MNKVIFNLEGVDYLQVVRLSGVVEMYELKNDKVEVKTRHDFALVKERFKVRRDVFMIAKEERRSSKQNIKRGKEE